MANFDSIDLSSIGLEQILLAENHPFSESTDLPTGIEDVLVIDVNNSVSTYVKTEQLKRNFSSVTEVHEFSPGSVLFDKIFVLSNIDFGFITEDVVDEILLWNSGRSAAQNKTVNSITKINDVGLDLDAPATPFDLRPQCDITNIVTAFLIGPPVQNTTYIYSIGSELFNITVVGIRIVAFPFEPNWKNGVDFDFIFETIINKNKRFVEQRRSLYDTPVNSQRASFLFCEFAAEVFRETIRNLNNKLLAIPIYKEAIIPQEDIFDLQTINTNDTTDLNVFNNFAVFVVILTKDKESIVSEVKTIQSITATTITFQSKVVKNFLENDTVIYPVFIGVMNYEETNIDAEVVDARILFKEVNV